MKKLEMFNLRMRFRRCTITVFNPWKTFLVEESIHFYFTAVDNRTRMSGWKLKRDRCELNVRKNLPGVCP